MSGDGRRRRDFYDGSRPPDINDEQTTGQEGREEDHGEARKARLCPGRVGADAESHGAADGAQVDDRLTDKTGEWHIAGIGTTDVVLVQVKTRDWPGELERRALTDLVTPPNCRKLLHRWRDRQLPDVQEL
jgi:hypothetical protein